MLPNEYVYRELQKINEHLRRENHLLRLLDELQHEAKDICTPADASISRTQDTRTEDAADGSTGNESQGTLVGDVDQKMDVDIHGEKPVKKQKYSDEKVEAEVEKGENDKGEEKNESEKEEVNLEKKEEKSEDKNENEKKKREEEEEEEEESDDDVSTWISNCTDEDSNEEDEEDDEDEKEVPEEIHIRELHHCNPRAHRNAMLSLFKRDGLGFNCSTPMDDMHIELHQDVKDCSSLKPMTLGNCKFDASLYMASDSSPYKRTDVWVYRLLYGLHPAVVLWIGEFPLYFHCPLGGELMESYLRRLCGSQTMSLPSISWKNTPRRKLVLLCIIIGTRHFWACSRHLLMFLRKRAICRGTSRIT